MNKIEICKLIQSNISKLTNEELIELFKIIKNSNINFTKNNNGVFLNLNWLTKENLNKIKNYISFCIKSQNEINKYEMMKSLLNDSINTNEKPNTEDNKTNVSSEVVTTNSKQKFSSSMKFYLLKKKFMKQNIITNNMYDRELKYEDYVIT